MIAAVTLIYAAIQALWPQESAEAAEARAAADLALASGNPMGVDQARDLALFARAAVHALSIGQATDVDVNNLSVIGNIAMLLAECGYGVEALGDITAGMSAVVSVKARLARTGRAGASGPELRSIRIMVEIHDEQLHLGPSQREMMVALSEMRRRMAAGEVMA